MTESSNTPAATATDTASGQSGTALVGIGLAHILFIALLVSLFSVVWFGSYQWLNKLVWENGFVAANRWTLPVGIMFFSLLVGLARKYFNAPSSIEGEALDPLLKGDTTSYKNFLGTLATSFFSLLSGASIGPEGPLGYLAVDVSEWLALKMKLVKETYLPASIAGISSAYNGLIGSSVFAALMATETSGGKGGLTQLAINLSAGVVGFLVFNLLHIPPFAGGLQTGPPFDLSVGLVLWAIALGLVGAILAVYTGLAMRVAGRLMDTFKGRPVIRALVGGAVIAVVCFFIPALAFSGESSIGTIIANPAQVGVAMLLLLALLKPLLLALSFKTGYLGGPIFPVLFAAIMIGLAFSLLFPGVPVRALTACIQAGAVVLVLNAPLTSIFLVSLISGADSVLTELIVVSTVTAMIAGQLLKRFTGQDSAEA